MARGTQRISLLHVCALGAALALCSRWFRASESTSFVGAKAPVGRQHSKIPRGPGIDKDLKNRIDATKKAGKVTEAMRLVAAARVRQAQDKVKQARPFSEELQSMIKGLVKKVEGSGLEAELPMLRTGEVKQVALVVFLSDKGLCGGYNSVNMGRLRSRILALNEEGYEPIVIPVGKKGPSITQRLATVNAKYSWDEEVIEVGSKITAKFANKLGDRLSSLFISGEVDKIEVIYTKFVKMMGNDPVIKTLLPLSPTNVQDPEDETFKVTTSEGQISVETTKVPAAKAKEIEPDVIFDQPPETILNSMLPLYLNSQILQLLYEAQASELAARMTAMQAATKNAKEQEEALTTIFNSKRQAAITQELLETASAAEATSGGGEEQTGLEEEPEALAKELLNA